MYKQPGRQKVEINAVKQNIEKRMKRNEGSLTDLWDNIKCINIHIIGVPGEEREKGPQKILEEITAESFPNMGQEIVNHVPEAESHQDKSNEEYIETYGNQTDKN